MGALGKLRGSVQLLQYFVPPMLRCSGEELSTLARSCELNFFAGGAPPPDSPAGAVNCCEVGGGSSRLPCRAREFCLSAA